MNVQVAVREAGPQAAPAKLAIADCDLHPYPKSIKKELYPFLEKRWQTHLETYGMRTRQGFASGLSIMILRTSSGDRPGGSTSSPSNCQCG